MSSTSKTEYYGLNSWAASDRPERADFNSDNQILDTTLGQHCNDAAIHVSAEEKERWNTPCFTGTYMGDGAENRAIETSCPFTPSAALIYAAGNAVEVDFESETLSVNFAAVSEDGATAGASLEGTALFLSRAGTVNLNEAGKTYVYLLFR